MHKVFGASDKILNAINRTKYADKFERVGIELEEEIESMYGHIDSWLELRGFLNKI